MSVYSIKDLEKLSGIKAHTIRIWEQRYSLLHPKRTDTNIRYYLEDDLKLLLNVALLNRNGYKISKIAKLTHEEIIRKVEEISSNTTEQLSQVDALTMAMIEMDEYKFDRIITANIHQIGFERTVIEVIQPFLEKLSVLWLTGSVNPCQENFITCLIRQKLLVAIDNEPVSLGSDVKKFVLFLPENVNQELSLLLLQYLIKARKHRVIYLGNGIHPDDLSQVAEIVKPDYFFTIISEFFNEEDILKYIKQITNRTGNIDILITGLSSYNNGLTDIPNIQLLKSLDETIAFLDKV
ncbi:MAG: MerR family transcriptional regulator [Bacteroidia bacterium]|nr:MerR family transcriptional regulator [Bacteroidia bacterium]